MGLTPNRRKFLKKSGIGGAALVAGCLGTTGEETETVDIEYYMVDGAADIPIFLSGQDDGIWEDHNINLDYNITGYGEYARSLTGGGPSNIGSLTINMLVDYWEQGDEVVYFGPNMQQVQSVIVRKEDNLNSLEDLEGVDLGSPTLASAAPIVMGSMIAAETGLDIREDTNFTESDPPALWELFVEQGEFDAILQFTGFTIASLVHEDLELLMQANKFWEELTGFPSMVLNFTAKKSWLEDSKENAETALRFLEAWEACVDNFLDDPENHMKSYGVFSGLQTDDQQAKGIEMWKNGEMSWAVEDWDQEFIDNQWKVKQHMEEYGFADSVPPKDEASLSISQLEEQAGREFDPN